MKRLPGASVSRFLPPPWPPMHLGVGGEVTVPEKSGGKKTATHSSDPEWPSLESLRSGSGCRAPTHTGDRWPPPRDTGWWGGINQWLRLPRPVPWFAPPGRPHRLHSQSLGEGTESLGHGRQPLPGAVHATVAVAAAGHRAQRRRRAAGLGRATQPEGEEAEQPQRARHCCGRLPRRPFPRCSSLGAPPPPSAAPGQPACGLGPGLSSLGSRTGSAPSTVRGSSAGTRRSGVSPFPLLHGRAEAAPVLWRLRPAGPAGSSYGDRTLPSRPPPGPGLPLQLLFKIAERCLQPCRPLAPAPRPALAQTPGLFLARSPPRLNLLPSFPF